MNENEPNVVVSWKGIARYFTSGVRTVQRWEHECGLPVHRPKGGLHGTVIALKSELDQWAAQCLTRGSMTHGTQIAMRAPGETKIVQ